MNLFVHTNYGESIDNAKAPSDIHNETELIVYLVVADQFHKIQTKAVNTWITPLQKSRLTFSNRKYLVLL